MAKLAVFGNLGDALIKPIVPGQKNKQTEPPPKLNWGRIEITC